MNAKIGIDTRRTIGAVNPRLFGGFVEHLGRAIYGGLYDPDSPQSDDEGWRTDVLKALRQLDFTILRYPGGNFVSGYNWRDGIGPREARKQVLDEAWNSLEPNLVGTDEFLQLASRMGWEPMITVNLGNGSPDEAAEWVQYCKDGGYRIPVWCLGNEMDGEWQIGHVPAPVYAEKAREAARLMRAVDPRIELVACGSSNPDMATWLEWDRTVVEALHDEANYISLHRYATNFDGDSEDFLAITNDVDRQIEEIDRVCREVAAEVGAPRRIHLCFDEWNVWYRTQFKQFSDGQGAFAPHLIEEVYSLEDALVVAGFLNSFVRHADVVQIANLAQIVNAIAPILTTEHDLLLQSIFWPFEMFSSRRVGVSLRAEVDSPRYSSKSYGEADYLDVSAIQNGSELSVFCVNRSPRSMEVDLETSGVSIDEVVSAECVSGSDLGTTNTLERPDEVSKSDFEDIRITRTGAVASLPGHSFVAVTVRTS